MTVLMLDLVHVQFKFHSNDALYDTLGNILVLSFSPFLRKYDVILTPQKQSEITPYMSNSIHHDECFQMR